MIDGLKTKHRQAIIDALATYERVERAVLFGSRAQGTFSVTSDVDIALFGDKLNLRDLPKLMEAIDRLMIPQKVDLLLHNSINNEALLREIKVHGVDLYRRSHNKSGWKFVTLGEICSLRSGSVFKLIYQGQDTGDYPFIKVSDMELSRNKIRINDANNWISHKVANDIRAKPLPPGSIVFAKIGEALKRNRLRILIQPTIVDNNMMGAVPKADIIDPSFLFFAMHQFDFGEIASGTALPYLTISSLTDLALELPSIPEQKTISYILGTLDDKIELNQRMNETLEEMARALFKSWFVDFDPVRAKMDGRWQPGQSLPGLPAELYDLFPDSLVPSELGEIPYGWGVTTLGDISYKPQYGYTASAQLEPVGPKFLRITDINKLDWIEWHLVPFCVISDQDYNKYHLTKGDIVIARMADPGHGVMIEQDLEAVFASYLIRFRPKVLTYARFIQYWLRSDNYWSLVHSRSVGTTRVSLNAKVLSQFLMVRPSEEIVAHFAKYVDDIRDRIILNVVESEGLTELRDTLLPRLLSGEVLIDSSETFQG